MATTTKHGATGPMTAPADALLTRIVGEYQEMPGLSVNLQQAQRLWQLDEATCRRMLAILIDRAFLKQTGEGTYVRRD